MVSDYIQANIALENKEHDANLFTGWADVDLSEKGTQQAIDAGKLIQDLQMHCAIIGLKNYGNVLQKLIYSNLFSLVFSTILLAVSTDKFESLDVTQGL